MLSDNDDTNSSTGNGTGIIDPEGAYRFPIVANRFYGIGTGEDPIDLGMTSTRSGIIAKLLVPVEVIIEKNSFSLKE